MGGRLVSKRRVKLAQGAGIRNDEAQVEVEELEDPTHRKRQHSIDSVDEHNLDADPPVAGPSSYTSQPGIQPPKPKKAKATPAGKGKKAKGKGKATVEFTLPWPEHFKKLEQAFKALNTVYTFCQARRHLATTFENLRTSVEGLLKRPLAIDDIAQMKSLLPSLIKFAYIEPETLRVHLQGAETKEQQKDDAFAAASAPQPANADQHVLFFQFNDGELKASNKGGKVVKKRNRKSKDGKTYENIDIVPTFSPANMTKMIEKRNERFAEAVNELLVACATQDQDAMELLMAATKDHLPVQPELAAGQKSLSARQNDLDFFLLNPDHRPSIETILSDLQDEEFYEDQIVNGGHRIVESREAVYGDLDTELSPNIMDALYGTKKITQLYAHQAEAINHLSQGRNVIVSTSTSSGKSLIYQLPALTAFEADIEATAMYIFPTKALAQDQKRSLTELLGCCEGLQGIKVATFDGDTPQEDRAYIRENASVIFVNPDMLHVTILPREEEWRRFFTNLKLVVLDELHMYTGLFGSHVALVMRRLRRICSALGNHDIRFVSCSATISNPAKHMEAILGVQNIHVVSIDGSPSGRKEHVVWNPPFIDKENVTQGRVHTISEASKVFRFLMDRGVRCIVFCKIRKFCELLMKQVRADLMTEGRNDMAGRVMSYRSGYSAQDRRNIEQRMFKGELLGIIATTALELGIDIGSLDAVITVGFPYTLSGLRQQAGRAGRRNKDSLALLICDPWPLDQHYAKSPNDLYTKPDVELNLDLNNELVLEGHLQCAADEMPIHPVDDEVYFGSTLPELCSSRLVVDDEGFYHCHPRFKPNPARHVTLRAVEDEHYSVVDVSDGKYNVLEETEWSRALFEVYEGAVFMHQGRSFLVNEVDHTSKIAKVSEANVDWSTKQRDFTDVDAIEAYRIRQLANSTCRAYYGKVKITSIVFGYFKVDRRNNILDVVDIDTPPYIRDTHGFWLDVPYTCINILNSKKIHVAASIHAAEHALLSLTPMFVMSVSGDVRTECKPPEKEFAKTKTSRVRPARLTLYDAQGKGGGICAKAFDRVNELLSQAYTSIVSCPCAEGCPSCIASTVCSEGNIVCSKIGAQVVLASLLGHVIDVDAIPEQDELQGGPGQTIEIAPSVRSSENATFYSAHGTPLSTPLPPEMPQQESRELTFGEAGGFVQM